MFLKFGKVGFVPHTKIQDFVEFLEKGTLMATRCKKCGNVSFPPRTDCVKCLSQEFEWHPIKGEGTLFSFTRIHSAPAGFEHDSPYYLGVLEMREGRLLAPIEVEKPEVGMKLKIEIKKFDDRVMYVLKEG